ncbi:MAG: hypothetical protein D6719_11060 [Candidatus Dadabacteria bacterium]|nr:MAG: hypothetical protein D6719_11060 [Candidatus Dadabacteria bacterium]
MNAISNCNNWIEVLGLHDSALADGVRSDVLSKIEAGEFTADEVEYVRKVSLRPLKGRLEVRGRDLELLRRISKLSEVDLRPAVITSHRKILGPFIVAAKRLFYPILKVFLKDFIRQQKDFNAAVTTMLVRLANGEKPGSENSHTNSSG